MCSSAGQFSQDSKYQILREVAQSSGSEQMLEILCRALAPRFCQSARIESLDSETGEKIWRFDLAPEAVLLISEPRVSRDFFTDIVTDIKACLNLSLKAEAAERYAQESELLLLQMSHELRAPLTTLSTHFQLLGRKSELENFNAYFWSRFGNIEFALKRMSYLVCDFLDYEKYKRTAAKKSLTEPIDAASVIENALELLAPLITEKRISIDVFHPMSPLSIMGNREGLFQVLTNLLKNAIKFTPQTGRISLSVAAHPEGALFSVEDTGPGVPENNREKVFEPFWQGSPSGSQGGSGLGLAIAELIISRHGGRLWVENSPGAGAKFLFTLPYSSKTSTELQASERLGSVS